MNTIKKNSRMLSNITRYTFIFAVALMFVTPVFVNAECINNIDTVTKKACTPAADNNTKTPAADNNPKVPAADDNTGGVRINTGIKNPLGDSITNIPDFIVKILNIVLIIAIPIIALAIIYSGFLFVTSGGNSEQLKKAKKTLLYTLIGAALILGSLIIAESIRGTVEDIGSTSK
jgi:flagellar basal body-associated protein FliL